MRTWKYFNAILLSLFVALVLLMTSVQAAKPVCGDNKCSGKETVANCPVDCSAGAVCGDGVCDATESCSSCEIDCGICPPSSCNNDGICNAGEDCMGCSDCPSNTGGKPANRYCCGLDDYCDTGDCGANTCDPVPVCGNNFLEYSEECDDGNQDPGDGCDNFCLVEPIQEPVPQNQFNVGDSIGEAEAANGTIGAANHQSVWSTGYASGDIVSSLNERFEATDASGYTENNATLDPAFNKAVSGSVMADFAGQVLNIAAEASGTPSGTVGMVTVLLGNNDVCADSIAEMTDPALFEAQYRAGLDELASSAFPGDINVQISSIPAIYWLWNSKRNDFYCRIIAWPFVPCQNLLENAADDCASTSSREDPDNINPGDGANCQRRKQFHAEIRDTYNPILRDVLADYQANGQLLNADYVDIFDVRFSSGQVNDGDCFHPSTSGQSLLAEEQWCRSRWGAQDPMCSP